MRPARRNEGRKAALDALSRIEGDAPVVDEVSGVVLVVGA
jgi:hypothetical protein